jgi:heme/copper-type cytochrome/quinol oxidase subunit 3
MEGAAAQHRELDIEPEPTTWQPRATWVGVRGFTGGACFFFISFVFAYFYLKSQDANQDWKIGTVSPSVGLGAAVLGCIVISALALRMAVDNPALTVRAGMIALTLALLSVVFQVIQWGTIGFGPASGGYASVYIGWTIFYSVAVLFCCYWIETQVATAWRRRADPVARAAASDELVHEGLKACSFFWSFMAFNALLMFLLLYALG